MRAPHPNLWHGGAVWRRKTRGRGLEGVPSVSGSDAVHQQVLVRRQLVGGKPMAHLGRQHVLQSGLRAHSYPSHLYMAHASSCFLHLQPLPIFPILPLVPILFAPSLLRPLPPSSLSFRSSSQPLRSPPLLSYPSSCKRGVQAQAKDVGGKWQLSSPTQSYAQSQLRIAGIA